MAIASPVPLLNSVLTSSNDNTGDFVNQLRNHLTQIETNFQETLKKIQERQPYTASTANTKKSDSQIRNQFFDVLKDVAIKNNLPFDEPFYRQKFLDKENSPSSPKVDILRAQSSLLPDIIDQHLSPVNNNRRSQFAPVLSSTPVHQISPNTVIPVDLTLATPSVALVLTTNSTDLPAVPPSAIVPQRANLARTGGRPPRIPKKNSSPIKEQADEVVLAKEIYLSSKRHIKTKDDIIEGNIEIIIEEQTEILTEVVKQVQSTPLRGRKKKLAQDDNNQIPQLEPPPALITSEPETEIAPAKKIRGGRNKKKEEDVKPTRNALARGRKKQQEEVKPTETAPAVDEEVKPPRAASVRGRKKQQQQEEEVKLVENVPVADDEVKSTRSASVRGRKKQDEPISIENKIDEKKEEAKPIRNASAARGRKKQEVEEVPQPPPPPSPTKKSTRSKKLVEPVVNTEEPTTKVRATPSRGKKKAPIESVEQSTPKKATTKSRKRKDKEETTESPVDNVQPPSPKRRGGRNTKSKNSPPVETLPTPPPPPPPPPPVIDFEPPASTRSSRRGKKHIEISIEKQDDIVLNKKTRVVRGKKVNQPNIPDNPITVVDVVMASVTVSAPQTTTIESSGSKPPRPPVARKKKSLAMPSIIQTSPTTPPSSAQRIQSTSPINDKPLLPLPIPKKTTTRRRPPAAAAQRRIDNFDDDGILETISSTNRNQKRTRSSVASTPKRIRRDNLLVTAIPSTPGKKRNKCTCEKRRHRTCDICAAAVDT